MNAASASDPSPSSSDPEHPLPPAHLVFKPTWAYRFNQYGKTVAALLIGVGVVILGLAVRDLVNENSRNDESAACRSDIAAFHGIVTSELNALGWAALEAGFTQDLARRDEIAILVRQIVRVDIPHANELRQRTNEICIDPPPDLQQELQMSVNTEAVTGRG